MIFAVDVGNSNIVLGLLDDQKNVRFSGRIRSDRQMTKEEFMVELQRLLDIYHMTPEGIEGVVISSVVPALTDVVYDGMKSLTGCDPVIVRSDLCTGIRVVTENPESVGSDLVVDAVAAVQEHEGAIAIFDLGTATTCSVVDEKRNYLGTIIMPGVKISQDALSEKAAQLPYIRFEKPRHFIGKNTIESMQSGVIYGNAAMIDGLADRLEGELGKKITVIATGGIAGTIVPYCKRKVVYDPNLLLKGLWYIFHYKYFR